MQAEGRGDNIIPYIYLCKFIPCAEALPTEAENRLPQAILGKLSEWGGGVYILYRYRKTATPKDCGSLLIIGHPR